MGLLEYCWSSFGVIFGALPSLNGVVGVALLLPLTYNMNPSFGLIVLIGLYGGYLWWVDFYDPAQLSGNW